MAFENLAEIQQKLIKRGFKVHSPLLAKCEKCGEQGVAQYQIMGRQGGRDISLCYACGDSRSWRSAPGMEQRELDEKFSLDEFLK
jgi:hypothetical protein